MIDSAVRMSVETFKMQQQAQILALQMQIRLLEQQIAQLEAIAGALQD
jgi:hypothetical protein